MSGRVLAATCVRAAGCTGVPAIGVVSLNAEWLPQGFEL